MSRRDARTIRTGWAAGTWDEHVPILVADAPDAYKRFYALGNAIVPEVAAELLAMIRAIDDGLICEPEP